MSDLRPAAPPRRADHAAVLRRPARDRTAPDPPHRDGRDCRRSRSHCGGRCRRGSGRRDRSSLPPRQTTKSRRSRSTPLARSPTPRARLSMSATKSSPCRAAVVEIDLTDDGVAARTAGRRHLVHRRLGPRADRDARRARRSVRPHEFPGFTNWGGVSAPPMASWCPATAVRWSPGGSSPNRTGPSLSSTTPPPGGDRPPPGRDRGWEVGAPRVGDGAVRLLVRRPGVDQPRRAQRPARPGHGRAGTDHAGRVCSRHPASRDPRTILVGSDESGGGGPYQVAEGITAGLRAARHGRPRPRHRAARRRRPRGPGRSDPHAVRLQLRRRDTATPIRFPAFWPSGSTTTPSSLPIGSEDIVRPARVSRVNGRVRARRCRCRPTPCCLRSADHSPTIREPGAALRPRLYRGSAPITGGHHDSTNRCGRVGRTGCARNPLRLYQHRRPPEQRATPRPTQPSDTPTTSPPDEPIDLRRIPEDTPLEPGTYSMRSPLRGRSDAGHRRRPRGLRR